jgi:HAD superfamily hydrolase (TIGR01509 family)
MRGPGRKTTLEGMSASTAALAVFKNRRRPHRHWRPGTPRRRSTDPPETTELPWHPFELDTVATDWQLAFDSAQRALTAAAGYLPSADLSQRQHELAAERQKTVELLAQLADAARLRPAPWLSTTPISPQMLGIATDVKACLFDLDGVLTDSDELHSWAWAEVFDEFLLRLSEKTGWQFIPFDRVNDYRSYIDGRPRLEGIHAFFVSRGIHVASGRTNDPADADTAYGIARHKSDALERGLRQRGVTAQAGARRYLESTGHAGLARAVISASASTLPILELAGLSTLVEERVDADLMRIDGLRSRPAPDLLLAVCRRLGVEPEEAVTFTETPAGVAAGLAAGLDVVGVGKGEQAELLKGFGAERVVPSLSALLDSRLLAERA